MLFKLKYYGVEGKIYETICNLYANTHSKILIDENIGPSFPINIGVKQGDPLSSFLFNVDMIPLCSNLNDNKELDAPALDNITVPSLFWVACVPDHLRRKVVCVTKH